VSEHPLHEIGPGAADEAASVLAEAFAAYPTTAWFFEPSPLERAEASTALMRFFVTARWLRGEMVLGVRVDGRLAAVALASFPGRGAAPPELADARERLWSFVGAGARERYEAYGRALEPLLEHADGVHVNVLGVRPEHRGRGLARALLDHVHVRASTSPCAGVSLVTEDPANLPFYRHLGFEVTGSTEVAPGITAWALLRPSDPLDVDRT